VLDQGHDETIRGEGLFFRKDKRYDCFSNKLFETFSGMRGVSSSIRVAKFVRNRVNQPSNIFVVFSSLIESKDPMLE
jgi:hypothetical protein